MEPAGEGLRVVRDLGRGASEVLRVTGTGRPGDFSERAVPAVLRMSRHRRHKAAVLAQRRPSMYGPTRWRIDGAAIVWEPARPRGEDREPGRPGPAGAATGPIARGWWRRGPRAAADGQPAPDHQRVRRGHLRPHHLLRYLSAPCGFIAERTASSRRPRQNARAAATVGRAIVDAGIPKDAPIRNSFPNDPRSPTPLPGVNTRHPSWGERRSGLVADVHPGPPAARSAASLRGRPESGMGRRPLPFDQNARS